MSTWQRFLDAGRTLGPSPGVREAWHQGRGSYAVWALLLDDEVAGGQLRARADAVAAAVAPLGVRPVRQLHVTVFVAGFPALVATRPDDVATVRLARQLGRARAAAGPLALEVGGASSFQTCAMLEVTPVGDALARLRAALTAEAPEVRFAPYQPHVTAAIYDHDGPAAPVAAALAPLRDLPPLRVAPARLDLVVFDAARDGAPLRPVAGVALSGQGSA
ncbi:MAG: 2'-5' RNA ligase family protein [Deltaproteobacteria bacterium]|nr:2'-5' RNA ligase family protein [Deltaproteobacteria bacterium]